MIIEPILREPGSVSFSWMEIQRTKASLVQQIDQQTNFTANETLLEFGLYPKDGDCEHKCPELDACIASNLWCDGNCFARKFPCGSLNSVFFKATPTARRDTTSHRVSVEPLESLWNYLLGSTQHWHVWQQELQLALSFAWLALHAVEKIPQSRNIRHRHPR
jgi:hypothetical protein